LIQPAKGLLVKRPPAAPDIGGIMSIILQDPVRKIIRRSQGRP
jgi:hypothetical protein